MRGEAEQRCLELVRNSINDSMFFATSIDDDQIIRNALMNAVPNSNSSEFPDFIFDGGFIEHFQVTSSATNRKGSMMAREKSSIEHDFEKKAQEATRDLPINQITIQSVETEPYWHKVHSYENFVSSFKSNFEHHIDSSRKYHGDNANSIFLIEYMDSALLMDKKYPQDLMCEVAYGDLLPLEDSIYRLSRDIELLKYVKEQSDFVRYVIFVNEDCFHGTRIDVINSSNALEIIKLLYDGYEFHCAMVGSSQFGIGVSIPNKKGDTSNE